MTGVCGTDKHIFKGEASQIRGKSIFPYIGGHEVIGTIVEIGDGIARVYGLSNAMAGEMLEFESRQGEEAGTPTVESEMVVSADATATPLPTPTPTPTPLPTATLEG